MNPKDKAGAKKCPHHLVPPRVLEEVAWAMKEGADKYGPYNWRDTPPLVSSYYSSTRRHLDSWFEGTDIDKDSGIHHISKAIAGLIVLRDAIMSKVIDDRPCRKKT